MAFAVARLPPTLVVVATSLDRTVLAPAEDQKLTTARATAEDTHKIMDAGVMEELIMAAGAVKALLTARAPAEEGHRIMDAGVMGDGIMAAGAVKACLTVLAAAQEAHRILDVVAISLLQVGVTTSADHQKSTTARASAKDQKLTTARATAEDTQGNLDAVVISLVHKGVITEALVCATAGT